MREAESLLLTRTLQPETWVVKSLDIWPVTLLVATLEKRKPCRSHLTVSRIENTGATVASSCVDSVISPFQKLPIESVDESSW